MWDVGGGMHDCIHPRHTRVCLGWTRNCRIQTFGNLTSSEVGGTCIAYTPTARDAAYFPIAYFELLSYCVLPYCVLRPGKIDPEIALRNLD